MQARNYEKSKRYFLLAYRCTDDRTKDPLYYHAQMLKSVGKYDSAKINFEKFKKEYKGSNKLIKKITGLEINFCDSIQHLKKENNKIVISHLDTSINKVNSESAPVMIDNNHILFSSVRTNKKEYIFEDDSLDASVKRKIYLAEKKASKWVFKGEYANFNTDEYNVGNAALSADRQRLYFTKCQQNEKEEMICAIYVSTKKNNEWSEPEKLPKIINNKKYTSTMPAIGTDPTKGTDVIYFVSNRPGGKGGLDIWFTSFDKKLNEYKPLKNCGNKINTAGDEITPFFDHETHSLFFSSNDLAGLGGFDIYRAASDGKHWTSTENLGRPYNSGADDIYYTIGGKHDEGYFVSNRKGGTALRNETCCDDIYYFKVKELIFVSLSGKVTDDTEQKNPVANAKVELYRVDKTTGEKLLVKTVETDEMGNYKANLEPNHQYEVVIRKKEFLSSSDTVSTIGKKPGDEITQQIKGKKKHSKPLVVPEINYEFGSAELTAKAKQGIDNFILRFLKLNPTLIIELQSHTDSKGSTEYNLKLSQKRADIIVKYLISKGVNKKRLIPAGLGESQPMAPNENTDGSDNPEGRAKNRRTEIKIIGETDVEEEEQ
jgi:outer membrane protein OmpA-like peptidoglycan-associated protein